MQPFPHHYSITQGLATQYTELHVRARLRVPVGTNEEQARRLLTKAEETCLVTNSLKVHPHLDATVEFEGT
jgi:organic hydroperoxide reductase OsmC/OhrA